MPVPPSTRDVHPDRPARPTRADPHGGHPVAAASFACALTAAASFLVASPAPATSPGPAAVASGTSHPPTQHPYCGLAWGSLSRTNGTTHAPGIVQNVRAGRHTCFDRLVIDVGEVPGPLTYAVRYVDTVRHDGSGRVLPLTGGATLQIIVRAPAARDGALTYAPSDPSHLVNVRDWGTFRQVALAGTSEGQTTVGLGVRARLPFRVLTLDGPGDRTRLVVDVAHRW